MVLKTNYHYQLLANLNIKEIGSKIKSNQIMIEDSSNLKKGQNLKIDINAVKDRLPQSILEIIKNEPIVELVGYKMVDGNQFGLVVKLKNGEINWFFEKELSEIM